MARSKCPKCDNTKFELIENSPFNSKYKLLFVQCNSCGSVVGSMDYDNIGTAINILEKKVDTLSANSVTINDLNVINVNLGKLFALVKNEFAEIKAKK